MVPKLHSSFECRWHKFLILLRQRSFLPQNAYMQFKKNTLEVWNSAPPTLFMATWYVATSVNNNMHTSFIVPDGWNYCSYFFHLMCSLQKILLFCKSNSLFSCPIALIDCQLFPSIFSLLLYMPVNLKLVHMRIARKKIKDFRSCTFILLVFFLHLICVT
jgi:hypothetical protein